MFYVTKFTISLGHISYWNNIRIESAHFAMGMSKSIFIHGGIRFVKYDRELGKCFWNNQEIDCLRAGEYINKKPEAYACSGGSPTNLC